MTQAGQTNTNTPMAITGIQAMQGHGVKQSRGFWAEAWSQVIRRFTAIVGISWLGIVAFFAVFAPFIASGHPIRMTELTQDGPVTRYPLLTALTPADWLLLIATIAGGIFIAAPLPRIKRPTRLGWLVVAMLCGTLITMLISLQRSSAMGDWFFGLYNTIRGYERNADGVPVRTYAPISLIITASIGVVAFLWVPFSNSIITRMAWLMMTATITASVIGVTWNNRPGPFDYNQRELRGEIQDVRYSLVPWSPSQQPPDRNTRTLGPGQTDAQALISDFRNSISNFLSSERLSPADPIGPRGFDVARRVLDRQPLSEADRALVARAIDEFQAANPDAIRGDIGAIDSGYSRGMLAEVLGQMGRTYPLGTDNLGQDMLSQLLHACRLSISIGLVSTGISLLIGITVGALMGYFGGWVDLVLYRFVEIFMAIPVLFLLIVAAGVLPKNIYVMMIIIGCFSWTGAARFIRAEFLKLRNMDFVQSARATGLPLRSILFKHMLPNGVTPVLVESSFAIAAAILAEATLSYLGLGPDNQASWGKLLASATGQSGEFFWWLAIFPGAAIFLTVLSYNLIGEALRDAIDPKLKKARV